jgi:hypothetical protein
MKKHLLLINLFVLAFGFRSVAQVSNIHGAWIEVGFANDSLEVRLMLLSKQQTLLPMSQTVSVAELSGNTGAFVPQPAIQLDRIQSADSNDIRFSVYRRRIPMRNVARQFSWNACCRGPLLNGSPASINESMIAYTAVYPDAFGNGRAESTRLLSFPPITFSRGLPQSSILHWQQAATQHQTVLSITTPIAQLTNNQFQPVSGIRLPNANELSLLGNELTVFASEAGNLAFNLRYVSTAEVNNTTVLRSHVEAAFQVNIQNATSIRNLMVSENDAPLEIFDLLGRYVGNNDENLRLAPGTYLFKRGQKIEKVQVF